MLFAHLKRILKLDRLRLRGPCGARDEFHLAASPRTCASWPSDPRTADDPRDLRRNSNYPFSRSVPHHPSASIVEFFNIG